jgi:SAM-dependent methyltransferase
MDMHHQPSGLPGPKAAIRGEPSYVWRSGQERRLNLIRRYVTLEGASVLDIGCGIGTYVRAFQRFTDRAYGIDVDAERVLEGGQRLPVLAIGVGEHLPFRDASFDLVLLNEVIEHVQSDAATLREAVRVVRPGGAVVIYAPNRLYPFETHGIYLGRRYIFGNIPLINYLPNFLRNRLVPHARAYTGSMIRQLVGPLDAEVVTHTYVYPGFDNVAARRPWLGRLVRAVCYTLESSPLRIFGLSHFVVLRRRSARAQT